MLSSLNNWLLISKIISVNHRKILLDFQKLLDFNFRNWNDRELDRHSISPMLSLINFSSIKFNLYSEFFIESEVENWQLSGKPDYLLSSGRREPETPYFVLQQYKKQPTHTDPAGQTPAAMVSMQALRNDNVPIYGCHVIENNWYFMVLEGRQYAITNGYSALGEGIFEIFDMLKMLKTIVTKRIG